MRPDEKTFTHMDFSKGHPPITLNAMVNSVVYDKLNVKVLKAAARTVQAKLTAMSDTGQ